MWFGLLLLLELESTLRSIENCFSRPSKWFSSMQYEAGYSGMGQCWSVTERSIKALKQYGSGYSGQCSAIKVFCKIEAKQCSKINSHETKSSMDYWRSFNHDLFERPQLLWIRRELLHHCLRCKVPGKLSPGQLSPGAKFAWTIIVIREGGVCWGHLIVLQVLNLQKRRREIFHFPTKKSRRKKVLHFQKKKKKKERYL